MVDARADGAGDRPEQCGQCFAWKLRGELHSCRPVSVSLRPVWLRFVGVEVRSRRQGLGMTQDDLALAVGLSRTSVTNIEAGRQDVPVTRIYELAAALRCTPKDLLP